MVRAGDIWHADGRIVSFNGCDLLRYDDGAHIVQGGVTGDPIAPSLGGAEIARGRGSSDLGVSPRTMRAGARQFTTGTEQDMSAFKEPAIKDGERIDAADIPSALTRAPLTYANGATQVFTTDGRTVYTEKGQPSPGGWKVDDDGRFQSFWPPSEYTYYDVTWIADSDGEAVGIRFADPERGATFEGRYSRG